MINRKISESKLLRKVREVTIKEQLYETILYETVMSLSNDNIEDSIKIIDEVIHKYPYMRNVLRTSLINTVKDFTTAFKLFSEPLCREQLLWNDFTTKEFGEMCCPKFIEDIAKHYSLETEIMNTFKFEQPFLNINFAIDYSETLTQYRKGYFIKGILYKSSKVLEKLYHIDMPTFISDLSKIVKDDDYNVILLRFLTPEILKTFSDALSISHLTFGRSKVLNECHEMMFIENAYKIFNVKRDGQLSTNNLYVSYLTHSHNGNFFGVDLINEFKLRPKKFFGNADKHNLIESWCENLIDYLKIDFNEYLRDYQVYVFKHNHIESSIKNILERVDMMRPIDDSTTILQAAVNENNEIFVKKILEKHPELVIVNDNLGNNVFNYFKKYNDKIFTMLSKEVIKRFSKDVLITMLLKETNRRKSFCAKFYKNDIEGFLGMIERLH